MDRTGSANTGAKPRKELNWWHSFNSWWRDEYDRLGRRPRMQEVDDWYRENAERIWGAEKPSLEATRDHAKCLRSKKELREYFQRYNAKKVRAAKRHRSEGCSPGAASGATSDPDFGPGGDTGGPADGKGSVGGSLNDGGGGGGSGGGACGPGAAAAAAAAPQRAAASTPASGRTQSFMESSGLSGGGGGGGRGCYSDGAALAVPLSGSDGDVLMALQALSQFLGGTQQAVTATAPAACRAASGPQQQPQQQARFAQQLPPALQHAAVPPQQHQPLVPTQQHHLQRQGSLGRPPFSPDSLSVAPHEFSNNPVTATDPAFTAARTAAAAAGGSGGCASAGHNAVARDMGGPFTASCSMPGVVARGGGGGGTGCAGGGGGPQSHSHMSLSHSHAPSHQASLSGAVTATVARSSATAAPVAEDEDAGAGSRQFFPPPAAARGSASADTSCLGNRSLMTRWLAGLASTALGQGAQGVGAGLGTGFGAGSSTGGASPPAPATAAGVATAGLGDGGEAVRQPAAAVSAAATGSNGAQPRLVPVKAGAAGAQHRLSVQHGASAATGSAAAGPQASGGLSAETGGAAGDCEEMGDAGAQDDECADAGGDSGVGLASRGGSQGHLFHSAGALESGGVAGASEDNMGARRAGSRGVGGRLLPAEGCDRAADRPPCMQARTVASACDPPHAALHHASAVLAERVGTSTGNGGGGGGGGFGCTSSKSAPPALLSPHAQRTSALGGGHPSSGSWRSGTSTGLLPEAPLQCSPTSAGRAPKLLRLDQVIAAGRMGLVQRLLEGGRPGGGCGRPPPPPPPGAGAAGGGAGGMALGPPPDPFRLLPLARQHSLDSPTRGGGLRGADEGAPSPLGLMDTEPDCTAGDAATPPPPLAWRGSMDQRPPPPPLLPPRESVGTAQHPLLQGRESLETRLMPPPQPSQQLQQQQPMLLERSSAVRSFPVPSPTVQPPPPPLLPERSSAVRSIPILPPATAKMPPLAPPPQASSPSATRQPSYAVGFDAIVEAAKIMAGEGLEAQQPAAACDPLATPPQDDDVAGEEGEAGEEGDDAPDEYGNDAAADVPDVDADVLDVDAHVLDVDDRMGANVSSRSAGAAAANVSSRSAGAAAAPATDPGLRVAMASTDLAAALAAAAGAAAAVAPRVQPTATAPCDDDDEAPGPPPPLQSPPSWPAQLPVVIHPPEVEPGVVSRTFNGRVLETNVQVVTLHLTLPPEAVQALRTASVLRIFAEQ